MKISIRFYLFAIGLLLPDYLVSQKLVNLEWQYTTGNLSPLIQWNSSIIASNGDLISVANTFHPGQDINVLITRFDVEGTQIWQREYNHGGSSIDYGADVIVDASGYIYICGVTKASQTATGDYLILRYTANGDLDWSDTYDGTTSTDDYASSLTLDEFGDLYITGASQGTGSGYDFVTLKYETGGAIIWDRRYDRNGYDDIAVKILYNPDLGIDITGGSGQSSINWDYVNLRYDINGNQISEGIVTGQGFGFDKPVDMVQDADGNVYITGASSQNGTDYDITTVMLDTNNQVVWQQSYGYPGVEDRATCIAIDDLGNLYVGGFVGNGTGNRSVLLQYSSSGNLNWKSETPVNDQSTSIVADLKVNDAGEIVYLSEREKDNEYFWYVSGIHSSGQTIWGLEHEVIPTLNPHPKQVNILSNGDVYVHAVSEENGQDRIQVLKATLKDRLIGVYYDTQNEPYQVKDEVIIRFAPEVINPNFVNNKGLLYGDVADVITNQSLINDMDGIFNAGGNIGDWTLIKMHPHLTTGDTVGTSRLGNSFVIPSFWTELILMIPVSVSPLESAHPERDWGEQLSALPKDKILYAYADILGKLQTNDPEFPEQRSLQSTDFPDGHIQVEDAWSFMSAKGFFAGDPSVIVGVMDEGIYSDHVDLGAGANLGGINGSIINGGWDFSTSSPTPINALNTPTNDHGTKVAGVIAALRDNMNGIAGIAGGNSNEIGSPLGGVHLYSMKLPFNCCGLDYVVRASRVKSALVLAATGGSGNTPLFDIMNNSWAFSEEELGTFEPLTQGMIQTLRDGMRIVHQAEIIVVNSRGNNNTSLFSGNEDVYPATFHDDWGISVGGATENGHRYSDLVNTNGYVGTFFEQSYYSKEMDIIAPCVRYVEDYPVPGVNTSIIRTTSTPPNNIDYFGATSAAAAHASGVVALLQSFTQTDLAPEDAEHLLEYGADDRDYDDKNGNPIAFLGYDNESGWGMLNAFESVKCLEPGFSGVFHFQSQPTVGSQQQIASNANIYLNYDYEMPGSGTLIPEGQYSGVKVYRYTKNTAHGFNASSYLYVVDAERPGYWVRNSSSNLWGYNPSGSLVIPEAQVNITQATITDATLEGYYYELDYNGQTYVLPEGADTNPQFAWSLLVRNDLGLVSNQKEIENYLQFHVYPNPGQEHIYTTFSLAAPQYVHLSVSSIQGQMLWQTKNPYPAGQHRQEIDISNLARGMYLLRLQTKTQTITQRMIKN